MQEKILFPIGFKLITIISIIVILSLGTITFLVSHLVREALQIAAEENNFEVNTRAAAEAEAALTMVHTVSAQLLYTLQLMGEGSSTADEAVQHFFAQNSCITAIAYTDPARAHRIISNSNYFLSRDINPALTEAYFNANSISLMRAAAGETILLNAAPLFERALIAVYFPWQAPNGQQRGACVLFSTVDLLDSFGFGANQSFLINDQGDMLIHPDFSLLVTGINIAALEFVTRIREAPERSRQELMYADFRFENLRDLEDHNLDDLDGQDIRYYTAFSKLIIGGCIVITGIEHDMVYRGIVSATQRNIYLTIAVLSISVLFIWFFSKSISMPLKALAKAAERIEGGQFKLDIDSRGKDEIGMLGRSFNKMSGALNIFGRFTNHEIAVKAMRGEIKPGGLVKHATIFFSDIRGFTSLSEQFTQNFKEQAPDKIVSWLNSYLTRMVMCIEKTGGVVDKFIGDAVMAHWGTAYTAGSPKEDAVNCITASLMMREELLQLNSERKVSSVPSREAVQDTSANDPANPFIQIGCGINTGMVTAGQIGSEERMEYTVIGDPVNLASRTESLTKSLAADILITEDTWKLAGEYFLTKEMGSVKVKGKTQPVRIFAVINYADPKSGPQSLSELRDLLGITAPEVTGGKEI